jgi:small-conductance mechanosensitive channel
LHAWIADNIFHTLGILQIVTAAFCYLLAWLLAIKIRQFLTGKHRAPTTHVRFRISPEHFALMVRYVLWVLFLLFSQAVFSRLKLPGEAIRMTVNLALVLIVVRFASFHIRNLFWSRAVYVASLVFISLRVLDLWEPLVHLLDGITVSLGAISFSAWGLIKSFTIFALLWALASAAKRFFARWLADLDQLTYSDRVLFQRLFNTAMVAVVIMVSLNAAGIHLAAIAVTGGAFGLAIGVGLQRIGSSVVSGILLLLNKPIRQGDVIVVDGGFSGARFGWVTRMGLMYVQVATRDGTEQLIPNESFVTSKIENLSYSDNRVRLHIPFGIAYDSDLKKAMSLALEAARGTERVLKAPEPACRVTEFGDSNVHFDLRIWIEDPRLGTGRVRSNVLLAIWTIFHDNGIQFAFPQRDIHIVDGDFKDDIGAKAPSPLPANQDTVESAQ